MNPFARHVRENLNGPEQKPEWIKRARKNWKAKVRRFAKKHGVTLAESEAMLTDIIEHLMQGEN